MRDSRTTTCRFLVLLGVVLPALLAPDSARGVDLYPGDVLVGNASTGGYNGKIYAIDPETGGEILVAQQGNLARPVGMVFDDDGNLIVVDQIARNVVRIDPVTGAQTVISELGLLVIPYGIARDRNGDLLVSDLLSFGIHKGAIIRVDPDSGAQTVVSTGGVLVDPAGIALGPAGQIYVSDLDADGASPGSIAAILRIDPDTGAQTTITKGGKLRDPIAMVFSPSGALLVIDVLGPNGSGAIVQVDPSTGKQTVLAQGGLMVRPLSLDIDADGNFLVGDVGPGGHGSVIRVDAASGEQAYVGPVGNLYFPALVRVVPPGGLLDRDGDGVLNRDDDCPDVPDPDQADTDQDGVGDLCQGVSILAAEIVGDPVSLVAGCRARQTLVAVAFDPNGTSLSVEGEVFVNDLPAGRVRFRAADSAPPGAGSLPAGPTFTSNAVFRNGSPGSLRIMITASDRAGAVSTPFELTLPLLEDAAPTVEDVSLETTSVVSGIKQAIEVSARLGDDCLVKRGWAEIDFGDGRGFRRAGSLTDDGRKSDGEAGDGFWTGLIKLGFRAPGSYPLRVAAMDSSGAVTRSEAVDLVAQ